MVSSKLVNEVSKWLLSHSQYSTVLPDADAIIDAEIIEKLSGISFFDERKSVEIVESRISDKYGQGNVSWTIGFRFPVRTTLKVVDIIFKEVPDVRFCEFH